MSDIINNDCGNECETSQGMLPSCAPLANAYVPMQECSLPQYEAGEAIMRGTLFPGLDLPFKNMVNTDMPDTPLSELMSLDFVVSELGLYLDTHKNDAEAFSMFKSFLKLQKEGRERYVKLYGPITKTDLCEAESYTWLKSPWPWEYTERIGE